MGAEGFDHLVRSVAGLSRRAVLRTLGGTAVVAALGATPAGARRRCPKRKKRCAGRCRNLRTDRRACGNCRTICPVGDRCLNGGCATTCASPSPPGSCAGATCTGPTCAPGANCGFCDTTTEGQDVCIDLGPPCEEFQACTNSRDCPLGRVCVISGCCDFAGKPRICVRPV